MDAELKSIFDKLVEESCRPEEAGGNTEHKLYDQLLRGALTSTDTDTHTDGGKTDSEREVEAALLDDLLPAYYNDLLTAQNKGVYPQNLENCNKEPMSKGTL